MTTKRKGRRKDRRKKGGVKSKSALQRAEIEAEEAQRVLSKTRKRLEKYNEKLIKAKQTIYDIAIKKILEKNLPLDETVIEIGKAAQQQLQQNDKLHKLIRGSRTPISYRPTFPDGVAYDNSYISSILGRPPAPEPEHSDDRRPLELIDFVPARYGLY